MRISSLLWIFKEFDDSFPYFLLNIYVMSRKLQEINKQKPSSFSLRGGQPHSSDADHYVCFSIFRPLGHREPRNEAGSRSLAKHPVSFESATFQLTPQLFRDGGPQDIETSPLICTANQWTGFNMIGTSVTKLLPYFNKKYNRLKFSARGRGIVSKFRL